MGIKRIRRRRKRSLMYVHWEYIPELASNYPPEGIGFQFMIGWPTEDIRILTAEEQRKRGR